MASPTKRRVLAPLDSNATVLAPSPSVLLSPAAVKPMAADNSSSGRPSTATTVTAASRTLFPLSPPSSSSPFSSFSARATAASPSAAKKRPREEDGDHDGAVDAGGQDTPATDVVAPWKRPSTGTSFPGRVYNAHPSLSPASSSVFDVSSGSLVDPSQATNITEPDLTGPPPVHNASRVLLTREQSRQKAEIIRLRLGLARYKLRTGQVDVPLEQLRVVPPSVARRSAANDSSAFARVPLALPSLSSSMIPEERRGSGEAFASEWVREQQLQRQAQQPQLPQQPVLHSCHSRSNSQCSSRSSRSSSCYSRSSRGSEQADADDEARDETAMKDAEDEDAEDRVPCQEDDENAEAAQEEHDLACHGLQLATPRPSRRPQQGDNASDDGHGNGPAVERLTSSVMRGNAVSGLLSLARS